MNKQITIVAALIWNDQGELLIAKRNESHADPLLHQQIHDKWEFVGGGIDFGEAPETAVIREAKEESGLNVAITRLFPKILTDIQTDSQGNQVQIIILTYECTVIGGTLETSDPEIGELKFVKPEEAQHYDGFKNLHQTAEILLKENHSAL